MSESKEKETRVLWTFKQLCVWMFGTLIGLAIMTAGAAGFGTMAWKIQREYPLFAVVCAGAAIMAVYRIPMTIALLRGMLRSMRSAAREGRW